MSSEGCLLVDGVKGKEENKDETKDERFLFDFERFDLYQRALEFTNKVFYILKKYPDEERFELGSQFRRASTSITLNLAEGYSRFSRKEKRRFYRISRGSIFECVSCLNISRSQNYIDSDKFDDLYHMCHELSRRISGLINKLSKQIDENDKPKSTH